MSKFYIKTPNGRIDFSTMEAALKGAQKAANRWGIEIGVFASSTTQRMGKKRPK